MNKPPQYPHFAQDWLAGTAHLSLEAQGAYQRLCDHEWVGGPWVGPLTDDPAELARLLGVGKKKFASLWREIGRHFPPHEGGGLYNPRIEYERQVQEGYKAAKSLAGKKGAEALWKDHRGKIRGIRQAAAMRLPLTEGMAKGMAKNGPSSSSSPSSPDTSILTQDRGQGRSAAPVRLSEVLGEAPTTRKLRRVQPEEAS